MSIIGIKEEKKLYLIPIFAFRMLFENDMRLVLYIDKIGKQKYAK